MSELLVHHVASRL